MTINITQEVEAAVSFDLKKTAEDIIRYVLEREGFPYEAEVDLLLTDNAGIHSMNLTYRQNDRPTDVLSFPMIEYDRAGDFSRLEQEGDNFDPDTGEAMLGDIVISMDKVAEQAAEFGHSEKREFAFLLVHSMLHLFGYDHMEETDAVLMEGLQRKILEELNILRYTRER